jgi:Spy/CpxP family protein refolding chaperone
MRKLRLLACAACLVVLSAGVMAQVHSSSTAGQGSSTTPSSRRGRQQPCWQQVGVSQAAEQQHKQIEENTRSQVEAVCGDSSLSQQQKQQKIRQLHEVARKQVEHLLSPQQEQAMKACREQRSAGRGTGGRGTQGGGARGEGGPCGEMTSGPRSSRPSSGGNSRQPQPATQSDSDSDTEPDQL